MIADVEWSNLHVAGAFLLGAVFSAIVVLRLARVIAQFLGEVGNLNLKNDRIGDKEKPPPAPRNRGTDGGFID